MKRFIKKSLLSLSTLSMILGVSCYMQQTNAITLEECIKKYNNVRMNKLHQNNPKVERFVRNQEDQDTICYMIDCNGFGNHRLREIFNDTMFLAEQDKNDNKKVNVHFIASNISARNQLTKLQANRNNSQEICRIESNFPKSYIKNVALMKVILMEKEEQKKKEESEKNLFLRAFEKLLNIRLKILKDTLSEKEKNLNKLIKSGAFVSKNERENLKKLSKEYELQVKCDEEEIACIATREIDKIKAQVQNLSQKLDVNLQKLLKSISA